MRSFLPLLYKCQKMMRSAKDDTFYQTLREKYTFRYSFSNLCRIPSKLSVSRLSPDVLDASDTSKDLFTEPKKTAVPDFFLGTGFHQPTSAERGTATHLFLQFCDFSRAVKTGAKEELSRLIEFGFLPKEYEPLVYLNELDAFLQGEFCAEIRNASQVIREQRFNLLMNAKEFTKDPVLKKELENESLAVQGVIDLILIDIEGRLSLFDYKTDRLTREELADPSVAAKKMNRVHGLQLSYYAMAAEKLFGCPCHRLCIYSTHSAMLYDVDPTSSEIPEDLLDTL